MTAGDRIFINVNVIIKYGVSINAVAESLKEGVKYKIKSVLSVLDDRANSPENLRRNNA